MILAGKGIHFQKKSKDSEPELTALRNRAADFVLADGGSRDASSDLILRVAGLRKASPELWEYHRARIRGCVSRCEEALSKSDGAGALAESARESQSVLTELGLSTPRIEEILAVAAGHGALAGKVSGAGGGGAVVLISEPGRGTELAKRLVDRGIPIVAQLDALEAERK